MRPIVITTPSDRNVDHFCSVFVNLLKQWHGCKGYAYNLITPAINFENGIPTPTHISYHNGIIKFTTGKLIEDPLPSDQNTIVKTGFQLLMTSPNHLIKLYPYFYSDFPFYSFFDEQGLISLINEFKYQLVYFEHRDKLSQMVSQFDVRKGIDNNTRLIYVNEHAYKFIELLEYTTELKKLIPGKTIYCEDFIAKGQNEDAIIELLSLDKRDYVPLDFTEFQPISLSEKDIANKKTWERDRPEIVERLSAII